MIKQVVLIVVIVAIFFGVSSQAEAAVLFDTGIGSQQWNLDTNQWLYAKFNLASPTTIDYIQAYTTAHSQGYTAGTATLAIYGDAGSLPNRSNQLFSQSFSATSSAWSGVSGMNLSLAAGNYWAGFEVRSTNTYFTGNNTFFGGIAKPAPNPLFQEAATGSQSAGTSLYSSNTLDISVRAGTSQQQPPAVPEPASMLLLASGLLATGLLKIRKK